MVERNIAAEVLAIGLAAALWFGGSAAAQSVASFDAGKQVETIVGSSPGGGYDIYGRRLVSGRASMSWAGLESARDYWPKAHHTDVLVQAGLEQEPDLPNVPLLTDLAPTKPHGRC